MFSIFFVSLLAWVLWSAFARPTGFLAHFAKLLDRPEFVDGLANRLSNRSFLKGEFRGRKVVVMLQRMRGRYRDRIIVSMETHASRLMDTFEFGGRTDRETEMAVWALEVKHEFKLRHEEGCLKAMWAPTRAGDWVSLFSFPPRFEAPMWQSVLEAMLTVAGSLERRAA